jgi:ribosome biogenesis protein NSA2
LCRSIATEDPSPHLTPPPITERHRKLHGKRLDHDERARKKAAREGHKQSENAQNLRGLRAKLYAKQRHAQKIQMRKTIKQHEERNVKGAPAEKEPTEAIPAYLLDRANPTTAKALSSQIKNKRAEKAARFAVPIPKVRGISEEELFKVYVLGLFRLSGRWGLTRRTVSRLARRSRRRVRFLLAEVLSERMLTM